MNSGSHLLSEVRSYSTPTYKEIQWQAGQLHCSAVVNHVLHCQRAVEIDIRDHWSLFFRRHTTIAIQSQTEHGTTRINSSDIREWYRRQEYYDSSPSFTSVVDWIVFVFVLFIPIYVDSVQGIGNDSLDSDWINFVWLRSLFLINTSIPQINAVPLFGEHFWG